MLEALDSSSLGYDCKYDGVFITMAGRVVLLWGVDGISLTEKKSKLSSGLTLGLPWVYASEIVWDEDMLLPGSSSGYDCKSGVWTAVSCRR